MPLDINYFTPKKYRILSTGTSDDIMVITDEWPWLRENGITT